MSDVIANLWTYETKRFTVTVDALVDHDPDLSFDETGDTQAKVESGEWTLFCARARVEMGGRVLADDYLGNCIYENLDDFASDHRDPDPMKRNCSIMRAKWGANAAVSHYLPEMVATVCREAREFLNTNQGMRQ